jgi:L-amino acid N-acyltransferase YncA
MEKTDWPRVSEIYAEGIATGDATFETSVPTWEQWDAAHHPFARLVATIDGQLVGWAALSPVSKRAAYSGVAEVSVYVAGESRGQGLGQRLLASLIEASESKGIWTLQASIFPENGASIEIHRRRGFREIGVRKKIAQLHGVWRDTVLFERRSEVV